MDYLISISCIFNVTSVSRALLGFSFMKLFRNYRILFLSDCILCMSCTSRILIFFNVMPGSLRTFIISLIRLSRYYSADDYSPDVRSVLGKTVPEVLDTARGHTQDSGHSTQDIGTQDRGHSFSQYGPTLAGK